MQSTLILGIESSCDETAAALVADGGLDLNGGALDFFGGGLFSFGDN